MAAKYFHLLFLSSIILTACVMIKQVKKVGTKNLPKFLRHHASDPKSDEQEPAPGTPFLDYAVSVLTSASAQKKQISSVMTNPTAKKIVAASSLYIDKISPLYYIAKNMLQLYQQGKTVKAETLVELGLNASWGLGVYGVYTVPGLNSAYMGYSAYSMYPVALDLTEQYLYGNALIGPKREVPISEFADSKKVNTTYLVCTQHETRRRQQILYWDWPRISKIDRPNLFEHYRGYVAIKGRWLKITNDQGEHFGAFATLELPSHLLAACVDYLEEIRGQEVDPMTVKITAANTRVASYPIHHYLLSAKQNADKEFLGLLLGAEDTEKGLYKGDRSFD